MNKAQQVVENYRELMQWVTKLCREAEPNPPSRTLDKVQVDWPRGVWTGEGCLRIHSYWMTLDPYPEEREIRLPWEWVLMEDHEEALQLARERREKEEAWMREEKEHRAKHAQEERKKQLLAELANLEGRDA